MSVGQPYTSMAGITGKSCRTNNTMGTWLPPPTVSHIWAIPPGIPTRRKPPVVRCWPPVVGIPEWVVPP